MQVLIEVKSTSNVIVDLSGAELEVFTRILGKMKFCESRYGLENTVLVESAVKSKDMFKLELSDTIIFSEANYEAAKVVYDTKQAVKAEADRVKRADAITDCFRDAAAEFPFTDADADALYRNTFISVTTGAGWLYFSEMKSLGIVTADTDLKWLAADYVSHSGDLTTLTLDANGNHTKTKL